METPPATRPGKIRRANAVILLSSKWNLKTLSISYRLLQDWAAEWEVGRLDSCRT